MLSACASGTLGCAVKEELQCWSHPKQTHSSFSCSLYMAPLHCLLESKVLRQTHCQHIHLKMHFWCNMLCMPATQGRLCNYAAYLGCAWAVVVALACCIRGHHHAEGGRRHGETLHVTCIGCRPTSGLTACQRIACQGSIGCAWKYTVSHNLGLLSQTSDGCCSGRCSMCCSLQGHARSPNRSSTAVLCSLQAHRSQNGNGDDQSVRSLADPVRSQPGDASTCCASKSQNVVNLQRVQVDAMSHLLRTLSHQSSRRLVVLGRLFNDVIHCFSVAIPSACICICCKLSWCLSCSMGVRSGVCTALVLLLLMMLVLHYNA